MKPDKALAEAEVVAVRGSAFLAPRFVRDTMELLASFLLHFFSRVP